MVFLGVSGTVWIIYTSILIAHPSPEPGVALVLDPQACRPLFKSYTGIKARNYREKDNKFDFRNLLNFIETFNISIFKNIKRQI